MMCWAVLFLPRSIKPLMKRLRMNLPLSDTDDNPLVEDPGTENFTISKPVDVEAVDRQIVLMFARRKAGKYIFPAEGYPLCKHTDIGNFLQDWEADRYDPDKRWSEG